MKPQRLLIGMPAGLLYAGAAYAGTTSPMGTVFTTVEGWLTGDIAKFRYLRDRRPGRDDLAGA